MTNKNVKRLTEDGINNARIDLSPPFFILSEDDINDEVKKNEK